jgi:serine/threonine-protein kinase
MGGSVPLSESAERAFFQSRLAIFYRFGFVLGLVQIGVAIVVFVSAGTKGPTNHAFGPYDWLFPWVLEVSATLACLLFWKITTRGEHSPRGLVQIDITGAVVTSLLLIAMTWDVPAYLRPDMLIVAMVALFLAGRAVLVPSTPVRTLAIGLVVFGALTALGFLYYSTHRAVEDAPAPGMYASFDAMIGGSWIAVTTLISRTLYGLRQQVRVAMQLGQYTLTEKIGEGGMGVVYKAQHAMLRRPTAVKLLLADKSGARDVARFEREVQLTSALTHPNTIQIYDYGRTPEGTFYYAMEYLDGIDLESLVELDGPQTPARIIALLVQVCGSLAEAHAVGLIHRDVKPANILLCQRGRLADVVKVLDFGLVKVVGDGGLTHLSREGTIAGTPQYMAPEAITLPEQVDARADIYAAGAVAYFLATGHDVFEAKTLVEVCAHHLHTKPERPSERFGLPLASDFEETILSCLAKSPDDRPQNAEQLQARLLACSDAGRWTAADGREWWRAHGERVRERRRSAHPASGTIGRLETDLQVHAGGM